MDTEKKLELLAEVLDADPADLSEDMALEDAGEWDSLAILSFSVMMGDEFGREVSRAEIKKLATVRDALDMMEAEA